MDNASGYGLDAVEGMPPAAAAGTAVATATAAAASPAASSRLSSSGVLDIPSLDAASPQPGPRGSNSAAGGLRLDDDDDDDEAPPLSSSRSQRHAAVVEASRGEGPKEAAGSGKPSGGHYD
ncbi:MAG: hypothetical protein AAFU61_17330, partial [Pseudomonadota bacterium]